jgi:hypothetical protein
MTRVFRRPSLDFVITVSRQFQRASPLAPSPSLSMDSISNFKCQALGGNALESPLRHR